MELVTPEIGLIFWTTVVFSLLLIVLKKYAWKPILSAVDERNKSIEDALSAADKAKVDAERILTTAKEQIINEKMKAITELKNQVANLSIEIAEKILKSELQDLNKQKELVTTAIANKDLN